MEVREQKLQEMIFAFFFKRSLRSVSRKKCICIFLNFEKLFCLHYNLLLCYLFLTYSYFYPIFLPNGSFQLAFTQLNIYKDIDHELAVKAVLHFFRQMKMAEMLTRHQIRHFVVLDLLTTVKIENCATFDTLDPVFFTGCHSLKHLIVTVNKKLEHLPRKVDISRCMIEYLQLEKNGEIQLYIKFYIYILALVDL